MGIIVKYANPLATGGRRETKLEIAYARMK
jgi:hypothetical protein